MKKRCIAFISAIAATLCLGAFVSCGNKASSDNASKHVWGDEYTMSAAYQKATELGYTGTLEEFIAMISGKDGADGADGKDGQDGVDGQDGKDGADGKDGQNGKDGADGQDGADGVGIKSVTVNSTGEIVITNTNDEVIFKQKLPQCPHAYSEVEVGLPAGCTYAGYGYEVCENCGDKQYTVLPPLGHDWDNGTIVYQATCAKNGYMYYTCDNCGETKSQILNATGEHSFKDGACEYCGVKYAVYVDEYYNNDYGYRYLATLSNGEDLCAFYDDIDEEVMSFHNDGTDAQYDGKRYVLRNMDYVKYGLEMDEAIAVWKTYLDDKPLYYWVSKNTIISAVSGLALTVVDEYADGAARTECNTELYGAIKQYVALASGENDYTVALAFHDKIIEAIDYAYDQNNKPETAAWAHNITGVLEGKGAVCEGYARTFQLLLNVRGINNLLVTGKNRTVDHAWNLAEIDGEWYWFDLTFDDTPNRYWGISHDYFCVTDDSFLSNHTPDNGVGLEFLYELPIRAQSRYDGDDAVFYDTFTHDGAEYVVVGYDTVDISRIDVEGEFAIPSTVSHRGREYSIVSIMKYKDGEESYMSTVPSVGVTSLHIPATVKYINDGALRGRSIETVTVDEDNPLFTAQDGVLFSKMKFVLIFIPYRINLKEYAIPDETVVIAKSAFSWFSFTNLEKLTVGKSVRWVGMANWGIGYPDDSVGGNIVLGEWNNMKLALCGAKQLLVHEENPYFVIQNEMLFNKSMTILYAGLPNIVTAVIPETVTRIEYEPFSYCRQLVSVKVNDGIVTLPHNMFYFCDSLTEVILPSGLLSIGDSAFMNCTVLQHIDIPSSVRSIGKRVFAGCNSLVSVVLPNGLTRIEEDLFAYCDALISVIIPNSVEFIGKEAFWCQSHHFPIHTDVYYGGMDEEWGEIQSDFDFDDYKFGGTIYFYSEEQPTTEGNYWHYVDDAPVAW